MTDQTETPDGGKIEPSEALASEDANGETSAEEPALDENVEPSASELAAAAESAPQEPPAEAPEGTDQGSASAESEPEAEAAVAAAAESAPQEPPAEAPEGTDEGSASAESEPEAEAAVAAAVEPTPESKKAARPSAPKAAPPVRPERPEIIKLREAQEAGADVEGKVIGWNNGGLHVVVDGVTAFCPRSEIEIGVPKRLESYLDQEMSFKVLRVQKRGRRVVLSRRSILQGDRNEKLGRLREAMRSGEVLEGKVSSVTDFGAFVDVGEIDGLVHVSELSRSRVEHASELVAKDDTVKVRVLKVSDDGTRISLSMKALEPDPWDGVEDRFPAGSMVKGTVERVANFGAFIELEPGLTGLLPTSAMNLPRNAQPARIYHPGKEISVQVLSVDRRRQRISLALEGSQVEGTRADLKSFQAKQQSTGESFGALAAAFEKARRKD